MKKAVLVVSFGIRNKEARSKTLDLCEQEIKEALPSHDFFKAYTSKRIIEKIKEKEQLIILSVEEALEQISQNHYDELVVVPLYVVNGVEFQSLSKTVNTYCTPFKKVIISEPLLTHIEDYLKVVDKLKDYLPILGRKEAVVLMGHGTSGTAQTAYPTLEYTLRDGGINAFVGTMEAYPSLIQVMKKLKKHQIETIILMPFLLAAGYHVTKDMNGDHEHSWKNQLEQAGYQVKVKLNGLAEHPGIRQLFIQKLKKVMEES